MTSLKFGLMFALSAVYVGCGRGNVDKSNLDNIEDEQRLVVVHGGFNSCGSSSFDSEGVESNDLSETPLFDDEKANVGDSFHFKLVAGNCKAAAAQGRSCSKVSWLKESIVDRFQGRGKTHWFVSCQPFDRTVLKWRDSRNSNLEKSGTREEMWADAVKFSANKGPINIAGHSYGGWTSMYTALKVGVPVKQIATLDPISVRMCTPGGVTVGSNECKRFPSDLNPAFQQKVKDNVGAWSHYWQTVDNGGLFQLGLHSGPVKATGVIQRELPVGHVDLNASLAAWKLFIEQI